MDELNQQLVSLQVIDTLRRLTRMTLPEAELILIFSKLSCETMGKSYTGSEKIRTRCIISLFGVPPIVIAKL